MVYRVCMSPRAILYFADDALEEVGLCLLNEDVLRDICATIRLSVVMSSVVFEKV